MDIHKFQSKYWILLILELLLKLKVHIPGGRNVSDVDICSMQQTGDRDRVNVLVMKLQLETIVYVLTSQICCSQAICDHVNNATLELLCITQNKLELNLEGLLS